MRPSNFIRVASEVFFFGVVHTLKLKKYNAVKSTIQNLYIFVELRFEELYLYLWIFP